MQLRSPLLFLLYFDKKIAEMANANARANQRKPPTTAFPASPVKFRMDSNKPINETTQQRFFEYLAKPVLLSSIAPSLMAFH